MKPPWEWEEDNLLDLIKAGIQESIDLDYKRSAALGNTDGKKNEISKDVSAFANSAGGTIVYGMIENKHVPTELDSGYDPKEISKEWLEQVINSRIQRRIDGVRVKQINLRTQSPGRVVYSVHIPQSLRAPHQAADKGENGDMLLFQRENGDRKWGHATFSEEIQGTRDFRPPDPAPRSAAKARSPMTW